MMLSWLKLTGMFVVVTGFISILVYALVWQDEIEATQTPTLITASDQPVKRRPDQPGGMDIPNRDKTVFNLLETPANQEAQEDEPQTITIPEDAQLTLQPEPEAQPEPVKTPPTPKPVAAAPTPPAPIVPPVAPTLVQKGDWGVQLASFKDRAGAQQAANTYAKKFSAELSKLDPTITAANLGDKGMRYRVQFYGLSTKTAATGLCKQLKRQNQGCLHVKR